jgi:hypothetical protein
MNRFRICVRTIVNQFNGWLNDGLPTPERPTPFVFKEHGMSLEMGTKLPFPQVSTDVKSVHVVIRDPDDNVLLDETKDVPRKSDEDGGGYDTSVDFQTDGTFMRDRGAAFNSETTFLDLSGNASETPLVLSHVATDDVPPETPSAPGFFVKSGAN